MLMGRSCWLMEAYLLIYNSQDHEEKRLKNSCHNMRNERFIRFQSGEEEL